jgi:Protein NO VEIN, C-terminal
MSAPWLAEGLAAMAERFAITRMVPEHLAEVRRRRLPELEKEESEVEARLRREILHWDHRAQDLRLRERAGKETRLSAQVAEGRANELQARLRRRQAELALARSISARPPAIVGGALVVPAGLLRRPADPPLAGLGDASAEVEQQAMDRVMAAERALGCVPRDVSAAKVGYDIESIDPKGRLRFIEVKGRAASAEVIIVTRNEILTALNAADAFILAVVQITNGFAHPPSYIRRPFIKEPDPQATAVVYQLQELLVRSQLPTLYS